MVSFADRLRGAYRGFRDPGVLIGGREGDELLLSPRIPDDPARRYEMLRLFRDNLAFRDLRRELAGLVLPKDWRKIRALENPALQAVEFHVMHVLPGTLEEAIPFDLPATDPLVRTAYRILRDGRFGIQKDYAIETGATCGDVFLRARTNPAATMVYPEVTDPDFVTEWEEDSRGNVTYIRLDSEDEDSDTGEVWTEIYDKESGLYALFHHKQGLGGDLSDVDPEPGYPVTMDSLGHDFVPFVRLAFRQTFRPGERCMGVFEPHLELIVQQNRDLTSLSDRYFRYGKPTLQVRRGEAGQAAVEMQWDPREDERFEEERRRRGEERIKEEPLGGGETVVRQPGLAFLEYLVPNIDWQHGLNQVEQHRKSLGRSMPEIRFFDGIEKGDPSALAIMKHQDPSYRRARAFRYNAEEALLASIKQCVSIGQRRGIHDASLGSFDAGDFDKLTITGRPIAPETGGEKAARVAAQAESYAAARDVSPEYLYVVLLEDGYTPAQARKIVDAGGQRSPIADLTRRVVGASGGEEDDQDEE